MSGKPKVFIFDCCSGNNAHAVAAGAAHSAQKREHADVLVVEAADPDFMSYKGHEDGGSVLTAILFNELRAMAGSDLVDVLACAKPKVSQYVLNNVRDLPPGNYYQTMHVALNTLTKKLVLPH